MKTKTNSKYIKKLSWAVLAAFSISLTTEALPAIATVGGLQQTDGATNVSLYKSKYNVTFPQRCVILFSYNPLILMEYFKNS